MSGEEDEKELELKDLIVQTLEANGLLAKIKAQLRASVFMALDENDKEANKNNDYQNVKVKKLLQTNEGRLAASLIRDFLECCNLDYTISVLDPELNSNIFWDKREKLCKSLNIKENESNMDTPILYEYLKDQSQRRTSQQPQPAVTENSDLPQNVLDLIQHKFEKLDTTKKRFLDKDKTKGLFISMFPNFSKGMMEKFIIEEIEANDLKSGVNFDDVVYIYKKLYKICCNVSSHANIISNATNTFDSDESNNKFGYLSTSRNALANSKSDDEDSASSNSSAAFKRSDSNKVQKTRTVNAENNNNKKLNDLLGLDTLKDVDDLLGLDTIKASKQTDDFFNFSKKNVEKNEGQQAGSKLGELPPLNNNFQNKFFSTSNSKDFGKKTYDDDYDDDFTNATPRTPNKDRKYKNRSALGSDEEIEDNLSYVEESSKVDDITVDRSISTVQGNNDADYIEDLSI